MFRLSRALDQSAEADCSGRAVKWQSLSVAVEFSHLSSNHHLHCRVCAAPDCRGPTISYCSSPRGGVLHRQHGLEGEKFGQQAAGFEHALFARPHRNHLALEFDTVEEETILRRHHEHATCRGGYYGGGYSRRGGPIHLFPMELPGVWPEFNCLHDS